MQTFSPKQQSSFPKNTTRQFNNQTQHPSDNKKFQSSEGDKAQHNHMTDILSATRGKIDIKP